ncbi:hypothetical protein FHS83_000775 [Rhizomicrobium palustre]|uniref:Regulator of ribonuclease activity B domain-containing protein n=1 Tax=Rhizomicrobium palustre TaxID=189966 RepID=A0A846MWU4_9PROT|nr:ribonuclease E inhibitor RraB [Rhizomicrobium palustre]NIK87457.1 hypothetical protein [Rhizomicrobium palustre]
MTDWPKDPDGDVFRSLEADGIDLTKSYPVDFFVDFAEWPPSDEAVAALSAAYEEVMLMDEDEEDVPALVVRIEAVLTYEFVTETQAKISDVIKPFGGYCMDWGVQI